MNLTSAAAMMVGHRPRTFCAWMATAAALVWLALRALEKVMPAMGLVSWGRSEM